MKSVSIATASVAQVEITRQQMSCWDTSARAWLSVADMAKKRKQTQLMIIIKDSVLPVNQTMNVYRSVLDAWKSALSAVDKITEGMPHSITDGAVLLGLASWHLYSDMYVLKADCPKISLRDPLVSSTGVVTLGIASHSPDNANGVYWSLPLAYLRYYGDLVSSLGTIGEKTTRLNLSEFFTVVLGTVFSGWGKCGDDLQQASKLVVAMSDLLLPTGSNGPGYSVPLPRFLGEAAEEYLLSEGLHKDFLQGLLPRGKGDIETSWPSLPTIRGQCTDFLMLGMFFV